jgi:N-acetylmuramoyl-L-alanine amidase
MDIQEKLLSVNYFSRPGKKLIAQPGYPSPVRGIVLHWVANPGTSAIANRNYFENLKKQKIPVTEQEKKEVRMASAHYIIGLEGEVIQCLPLDEAAYHVGAYSYPPHVKKRFGEEPNYSTIGIELCHPDWSGKFTYETWTSAVAVVSGLARIFVLDPLEDICTHYEITGKICPKYFVDHPEEFDNFKREVYKTLCAGK